MEILGLLLLLAVGSKAGVNKLFFSSGSSFIDCPAEGTFYQWKKYYSDKMTNLFSDDKRRLKIPLNAEFSPITYECSGTNGFQNYNENITIFVLDQQSSQARKLCYMKNSDNEPTAQYPCFLYDQKETVTRISKGSSVTLDCEAGGSNVSYVWYRLNTPNSHQELMDKVLNVPVLKIVHIDDLSAGQYLCVVNTTTGNGLKRYFNLQIVNTEPQSMIFVSGPVLTNITIKLHKTQILTCDATAPVRHRINIIQWAKKIDTDPTVMDKTRTVQWRDSFYRLISDSQVQTQRPSESSVTTSLELRAITQDVAGQYTCAFFTSEGTMTHRSFVLTIDGITDSPDSSPRSFLFLYILIPSLIIAICLFVGIYVTINRRTGRKPASLGTGTMASNCYKPDPEAMRLRTTPEYSINSGPPTTAQYYPPSSYYQPSDKMIL